MLLPEFLERMRPLEAVRLLPSNNLILFNKKSGKWEYQIPVGSDRGYLTYPIHVISDRTVKEVFFIHPSLWKIRSQACIVVERG